MSRSLVIIVNGLPATGKTTLAGRLALDLHLPFIYKDGIKDRLFDSLGWSDVEWSQKLGVAAYNLLFYFVEAQVAVSRSLVVEANFSPTSSAAQFRELQARYDFVPIQILLKAEGRVLIERVKARWQSGARHPGHVEHLRYDEQFSALRAGRLEPMDIGGHVLEVDTTDFARVDYPVLVERVRSILPGPI